VLGLGRCQEGIGRDTLGGIDYAGVEGVDSGGKLRGEVGWSSTVTKRVEQGVLSVAQRKPPEKMNTQETVY
jgi:hypothetical protein